jgi:hypothetical protein
MVLAGTLNERGLRMYADDWDRALPTEGISHAVREELSAYFSSNARKGAAKTLRKLLKRRGVVSAPPVPIPLTDLDATFSVGTDVATLLLGSFDAVERVSNTEDLDDLARAAKKEKCVGFATGGDGTYRVRIVGRPAPGAGQVLAFPLVLRDDTLTLSGIVGAGGTPTLAVASGTYTARVRCPPEGPIDYVVEIERAEKAPRWAFGSADLPMLAREAAPPGA